MTHDELIALYFEYRLNTEQQIEFDKLLRTNANFKAQFDLEQQVKTAIISSKKDDLRQRLQQLEQPKKRSKFYTIGIAASLIIGLGILSLWLQNRPVDNNQLFAAYFEPYANVITPSERGNDASTPKTKAFRYYDTQNYEAASTQFETLYQSTNTSYYLFYQAICELQLNNTNKAISLLEAHQHYEDKVSQHRNWYLALAYLKADNLEKSQEILKQIISEKTYKYKSAEAILEKID